jgi:hypothetical protein
MGESITNTFTALYKSGLGDINITINGYKVNIISHIVCPQSDVLKMFYDRGQLNETINIDSNIEPCHVDALFYYLYLYDSENNYPERKLLRNIHDKFSSGYDDRMKFAYYFNTLRDYFCIHHGAMKLSWLYPKLIKYTTEPLPITKNDPISMDMLFRLMYGGNVVIAFTDDKYHIVNCNTHTVYEGVGVDPGDDLTPLYKSFFTLIPRPYPVIDIVRVGRQEWITEEVIEHVAAMEPLKKCYYWFVINADLSVGRKYEILLDLLIKIDKNIRAPYAGK